MGGNTVEDVSGKGHPGTFGQFFIIRAVGVEISLHDLLLQRAVSNNISGRPVTSRIGNLSCLSKAVNLVCSFIKCAGTIAGSICKLPATKELSEGLAVARG
ncbi:hypothetical protein HPP92_018747 [Vanilla planifolia]|uniref:Uncharacterized protein n=1 Tax=Vanilla planifolia TaxID=51239 RepID=A0A835Q8Y2_VANPL|nr:hypothetical protein HPP92_019329 [Vanilla planifolia]KAG0464583.1 hypothetical protein HPP92_018747 [Vanilla planifolia]